MVETTFKDLEIACIANIFSRLTAKEVSQIACVSRLWNDVASDDGLWKPHLAAHFAGSSATKPDGTPAASFRAAYACWQEAYGDVSGPMFARAMTAWNEVKGFLKGHAPRILETLNPGASARDLEEVEQLLKHPLPLALRCMYRIHNGQTLQLQQQSCEEGPPPDLLLGLFGCVVFYDHVTSNALQPLDEAVKLTKLLRSVRPLGAQHPLLASKEMVFAASYKVSDKMCVVNCESGDVALKLRQRDWPLTPPDYSQPGACDGVMRWFEEYGRRLSCGWYGSCEGESNLPATGPLDLSQTISLFPRAFPAAATAITRGVKVTWSSVLVPQESRAGRLMFAYNVRFNMLTPQQETAALQQLVAEQQAWQQQRQQTTAAAAEGSNTAQAATSSTAAAAAGASTPKHDSSEHKMTSSGRGDAPAGPAEQHHTPPTLAEAAAAHAAAAGGGSSAAVADAAGVDFSGSEAVAAASAAAAGAGAGAVGPEAPPVDQQQRLRSPHAGSDNPFMQLHVLGPCSAAAGAECVPAPLAASIPWKAAAEAAGLVPEMSSSLAAPAAAAVAVAGGAEAMVVDSSSNPSVAGAARSNAASHAGGATTTAAAAVAAAAAARPLPASCQLESRHWSMYDAEGSRTEGVDGEGVVGLYPLLYPGSEVFSYASCTPFPLPEVPDVPDAVPESSGTAGAGPSSAAAAAAAGTASTQQQQAAGRPSSSSSSRRWKSGPGRLAGVVLGCMDGAFTFVEGSLMQRAGGTFDVKCPRLVFAVPGYIF